MGKLRERRICSWWFRVIFVAGLVSGIVFMVSLESSRAQAIGINPVPPPNPPPAQTQIKGCYDSRTGALRMLTTSSPSCARGELPISWSQTGPPGPTGATGPAGPPGVANGVTRAVHGTVSWDGGTVKGTGFYVKSVNAGMTEIWFNPSFNPANGPVTCQVTKLGQNNQSHDLTPANYYYYADGSHLSVFYTKMDGQATRLGFSFICVQ